MQTKDWRCITDPQTLWVFAHLHRRTRKLSASTHTASSGFLPLGHTRRQGTTSGRRTSRWQHWARCLLSRSLEVWAGGQRPTLLPGRRSCGPVEAETLFVYTAESGGNGILAELSCRATQRLRRTLVTRRCRAAHTTELGTATRAGLRLGQRLWANSTSKGRGAIWPTIPAYQELVGINETSQRVPWMY